MHIRVFSVQCIDYSFCGPGAPRPGMPKSGPANGRRHAYLDSSPQTVWKGLVFRPHAFSVQFVWNWESTGRRVSASVIRAYARNGDYLEPCTAQYIAPSLHTTRYFSVHNTTEITPIYSTSIHIPVIPLILRGALRNKNRELAESSTIRIIYPSRSPFYSSDKVYCTLIG